MGTLAQLGPIQFFVTEKTVQTLKDVSITKKAKLARHEILSGKAKLEFKGVDLQEVSFNIYLNASLGVNIDNIINNLSDLMENGVVCPFIVGPRYCGDFLISDIGESIKQAFSSGVQATELSISLLEYVDD